MPNGPIERAEQSAREAALAALEDDEEVLAEGRVLVIEGERGVVPDDGVACYLLLTDERLVVAEVGRNRIAICDLDAVVDWTQYPYGVSVIERVEPIASQGIGSEELLKWQLVTERELGDAIADDLIERGIT